MKIMIFGGGAVGLGIASCLIKSGEDVDIIARKNTVLPLRRYGLLRTGIFGEYHANNKLFNSYEQLSEIDSRVYDYILVCTKSYDTLSAANSILKYCNLIDEDMTKIILFQNGWGNAETFSSLLPSLKIYNATVITGFYRPTKNVVEITVHADSIHIGSIYNHNLEDIKCLCESISTGGIICELTRSIVKDLWSKMLYNCVLNPLGAIFQVPYGELGKSDYTRSIIDNIAKEVFNVMESAGYKTYWKSSEEYLNVFYHKFLPATAKHEASMLQDIKAKKKTEIDALNGTVVKLGEKYDIEVVNNRLIFNIIKFIENKYLNN